jgi:hypothetical protein
MNKIYQWLKKEFLGVIPAAVFFFIAFQLLALTRALILRQYDIEIWDFFAAAVGALIVAKVIMVVDLLPFVNRFPDKPLVYNVTWKATIYFVAACFARYVEHLVFFVREYGNLAAANRHLFDDIIWSRFWIVQIWLLVLLLIYCVMKELVRVVGADRVREVFLGPPRPEIS